MHRVLVVLLVRLRLARGLLPVHPQSLVELWCPLSTVAFFAVSTEITTATVETAAFTLALCVVLNCSRWYPACTSLALAFNPLLTVVEFLRRVDLLASLAELLVEVQTSTDSTQQQRAGIDA